MSEISREQLLAAIGTLTSAEKRALLGNQPVQASATARLSDHLVKLDTDQRAELSRVIVEAIRNSATEQEQVEHMQKYAPESLAACMANSARRAKSVGHSLNQCVLWIALNPTA